MKCQCYPDGEKLCNAKAVFRVKTYCESSEPKRSTLYYCAKHMRERVLYNLTIRPFGSYKIERLDEVT